MERVLDKLILLLCCSAVVFYEGFSDPLVGAFLLAVLISAFRETLLFTELMRSIPSFIYIALTLVFPALFFLLPLAAYDVFRVKPVVLKLCWVLPFFFVGNDLSRSALVVIGVLCLVTCTLSWRSGRMEYDQESFRNVRDESRELSLALERKNQELQERQDYEVRLATLAERGRIAREIHDNVGHLLTRSVLQIEALQVVHADDLPIRTELEQVGHTIHEAFDTVRESVHDLHDDAFDLNAQLFALTKSNPSLVIELEYETDEVPSAVGYGFLAIVRESLANTAKHSDSTTVRISVMEYPAFWQLVIHDNGSVNPLNREDNPFAVARQTPLSNAESLGEGTGIGLKTMEERARALGGVFRVDYNRGFRVFVSIPKEKRATASNKEDDR